MVGQQSNRKFSVSRNATRACGASIRHSNGGRLVGTGVPFRLWLDGALSSGTNEPRVHALGRSVGTMTLLGGEYSIRVGGGSPTLCTGDRVYSDR